MSYIHYERREIHAKVVYFGPHGSGKTTAIDHIYRATCREPVSDAPRKPSAGEYLPLSLGKIRDFAIHLHLYGVSGAPEHTPKRLEMLDRADAIVFVGDGGGFALEANAASYRELTHALAERGFDLAKLPFVLQLNKQDLPGALDPPSLASALGVSHRPFFGSVATTGAGVFESLKEVSRQVLSTLRGGGCASTNG